VTKVVVDDKDVTSGVDGDRLVMIMRGIMGILLMLGGDDGFMDGIRRR
jgi:hypothetical protein